MTKNLAISDIIQSRRTINLFQDRIVSVEHLNKAIDHARWAPNHRLTEPWHFYLLGKKTREKTIQLIMEIKTAGKSENFRLSTQRRLDAIPGWFVLTCENSTNPIIKKENYAACCCAAQNLMLYLWGEGIGVKWTTGDVTRDDKLYNLLKINKHQSTMVGLFWYGYPLQVPAQKRKPIKEITTTLE
ncbi:MAG: nitroreductase [Gammaproteobacteria bacterium]|nr:nitroreductase [Gammaproteobacteria bacterium]